MLPRLLTSGDLTGAMRLKSAAGWNQTERDWLRLLELAPDGCFGIDIDGELAATATAVCYGRELAWIGMVLTLPEYRRRGLARILMEHTLRYLECRQVHTVKLDASEMGRPLYESLGFQVEGGIDRWLRAPAGINAPVLGPSIDLALDRKAFGVDRSELLAKLASESASYGRPGANAAYFGPCVARSDAEASCLLRSFLAQHPDEPVVWDVLADNRSAVALAERHGFQKVRSLYRMVLGSGGVECENNLVFATAGFEYG